MKTYEFIDNFLENGGRITVCVHNTFEACFREYCEAVYDETKVNRGLVGCRNPEEARTLYAKMFKERGRWAWFQRGRDGEPTIHLCIDENEHKGGSLFDITNSLAHELDHFLKGGFFTAAEAEASAACTGGMAKQALNMSAVIISDRYARGLITELYAGDRDAMMDMDIIFECMAHVHKIGSASVNSGEWTQDALDERMYALAVAMIVARENKRAGV